MFIPLPHLEGLVFLLSYSNDADIDWARGSKQHGREINLRICLQYPLLGVYLRMRTHKPKPWVIASVARENSLPSRRSTEVIGSEKRVDICSS